MDVNMKRCANCKIEKRISEFNKTSYTKDKIHYYCRLCDILKCLQWEKNNRGYRKKYWKEKYTNDISFKLAKNLRTRLRQALLQQLTNKKSKTEELLGISFSEFKKYIEFLMSPEMSWQLVELDHIQTLSSFDLTDPEQLREAALYTNIQPLLKSDNRKKGSKIDNHDITIHRAKVYLYLYYKSIF